MRSRWGLGLFLFFAVFSIAVVSFGTSSVGPGRYPSVVISLVEFGVYLMPLAALTAGFDTMVGDYESGVLDMLYALPVSRVQVLVGKFLGRLSVLAGSLILGLGVGGAFALWIVGPRGIALYSYFVFSSITVGASFLGMSVLVSALTFQKIRALGYVLILWLWFVLLHDLLALGLISEFNLRGLVLEAMVVLNPTDLYRLVMLGQLEAPTGGYAALLTETSLSSPVLWVALLGWVLGPLGLAVYAMKGR